MRCWPKCVLVTIAGLSEPVQTPAAGMNPFVLR